MELESRKCKGCGTEFTCKPTLKKMYCTKKCATQTYKNGFIKYLTPELRQGDKGAYGELSVCCDLMKKGFSVFRGVASHGPFDLAAYSSDSKKLLKIEVTCGNINADGKISYSPHANYQDHFDHIAVVVPTGIVYIPPL